MDILLRHPPRLDHWESRPIWPAVAEGPRRSDHRDVYEAELCREPPGPPVADGPFRAVADAIFRYRIFDPTKVRGVIHRAPIQLGDTVGLEYLLLPGIRVFFASRVVVRFDGEEAGLWRAGFTYQTLAGHPELGEETFAVEKSLADGRVTASLRAWSRPGTLLARMGQPLVRYLQVNAGHGAIANLKAIATGASQRS